MKLFKVAFLALALVAGFAISAPAGDLAIDPLPSVIIGDEGDVWGSGETALHLFRYTNIMNIATSGNIHWPQAQFPNSRKHAYYLTAPDSSIHASTDARYVAKLTYADIAEMIANGTKPPLAKEITDRSGDGGAPDFFWLSLANNFSSATNAYAAIAQSDGMRLSDFGSQLDPEVVTLVLAAGDFPTTNVAQTDFTVYSVPGAEDGFSVTSELVYIARFPGDSPSWVWKWTPYLSLFTMAGHAITTSGLTAWRGTDERGFYFGTWTSGDGVMPMPVVPVNEAAMQGGIFKATFTLNSTATNAADTPGYRLMYMSEAFTHVGGIMSNSIDSQVGSSTYAPSAGLPKDVSLYWVPPFDLSEYGDAERLATGEPGRDFRDYFLNFDFIGFERTDTGVLGLQGVTVEIIPRPASGDDLVTWGAGNSPFNGDLSTCGWNVSSIDMSGDAMLGFGFGNASATSITLSAISRAKPSGYPFGYQAVGPFASASILPVWQSDKLMRVQTEIASSSVNASPSFRILSMAVRPTNGEALSLMWFDCYSGDDAKTLWGPNDAPAAVAPSASGTPSMIESYLYTHEAPSGSDYGVINPQIDCYAVGQVHGSDGKSDWQWPAENADLTITKVQYEECVK